MKMRHLLENECGRDFASATFLGLVVCMCMSPGLAVVMFMIAFAGQSGILLAQALFG